MPPLLDTHVWLRIIVATARTHGLHLATRDKNIRRSRLAKIWEP